MADLKKRPFAISARAQRVSVYIASLLIAPLPLMPYVKGTREFALALMACGAILSLGSFYAARGELKLEARGLLSKIAGVTHWAWILDSQINWDSGDV
jgi:hypothetical protein